MDENEYGVPEAAPFAPAGSVGAEVIDLRHRRLQVLRESVEKTCGKLKKLERRLIRGELKKGRPRRQRLERQRALSELEQRLGGINRQVASGLPSAG